MDRKGVVKAGLLVLVILFLFVLVFQSNFILSLKDNVFSKLNAVPTKPTFTSGGASVPITPLGLTEQGNNHDIGPGRLKFEFAEKPYAIQLRRVKEDYTEFVVMTLDIDKPEDITAYTVDNSFNLTSGGIKQIDLDGDGTEDIFIKLNKINSKGKYNSVRSADFFIKKIKNPGIK